MKNDLCLDSFTLEVIHMKDIVWIFCVKIVMKMTKMGFSICAFKTDFIY